MNTLKTINMTEIIDFNNINNIFDYGSKLIVYVYNNNDKLIDKYSLYVKMFSNMRIFSRKKPKKIISEYFLLIYMEENTNMAFLIEENNNFSVIYLGKYINRCFTQKLNYIYINLETVLIMLKSDSNIIEQYISMNDCISLLIKLCNRYQSIHLLQSL